MYKSDCHLHQPNVSLLVLKKETLPVNRRGQKKKKQSRKAIVIPKRERTNEIPSINLGRTAGSFRQILIFTFSSLFPFTTLCILTPFTNSL